MNDRVHEIGSYGIKKSTFEKNEANKAMMLEKDKIIANISRLEKEVIGDYKSVIEMMDLVEKVLHTCGGECKATYLDVNSSFLKLFTRVPLQANLFQFLPESPDNPRFHKVVTKILLLCSSVSGVRWVPSTEGERGAFLLVSLKPEEQVQRELLKNLGKKDNE